MQLNNKPLIIGGRVFFLYYQVNGINERFVVSNLTRFSKFKIEKMYL
jgi:hypothetical protein